MTGRSGQDLLPLPFPREGKCKVHSPLGILKAFFHKGDRGGSLWSLTCPLHNSFLISELTSALELLAYLSYQPSRGRNSAILGEQLSQQLP